MNHYRALISLGIPIVVGNIGNVVLSFADTLMVGHYGMRELAAASFVNTLFLLLVVFAIGFSMGITPEVGRRYGSGDYESIGKVVRASVVANLLLSLLLMLVCVVLYFQLHRMEVTQTAHALLDIFIVGRVAYPGALQKLCDLIAVLRVNIGDIITDVFISNGMIYRCFLTAIDKLVCTLSWNAHNVLFVLTGKQEGTIGHAFFQDCNIRDILRFRRQCLTN